jgi:hypothetical protein
MKDLAEKNLLRAEPMAALTTLSRKLLETVESEMEARKYRSSFDKVNDRFLEYARNGNTDETLVLSTAASQDAHQCWQDLLIDRRPGVDEFPVRVMQALAWLHYARHMALPSGRDADDLQASAVFFVPVLASDRDQLPVRMLEFFDSGTPFAMLMDDSRKPAFLPDSFVQQQYPGAYENAEHVLSQRS